MSWFSILILVIIGVSWVVRALSAVTGNDQNNKAKQRKARSLQEWDEVQARRRAEMAQRSRGGEPLEEIRLDASNTRPAHRPDPSQMSMAQRIELARQRARQQSGGGSAGPGDVQAEALRRARERAEQEVKRRRQTAAQQQVQREQAEREGARQERDRQLAERKLKQQEQAEAERRALKKSRSRRPTRASKTPQVIKPVAVSKMAEHQAKMRAESYKRVHQGHGHGDIRVERTKRRGAAGSALVGSLSAASLRKAIVMKELLDKPIALRNPQDELLL